MMETILKTTLCISSTICLWSAFLLAYNWQEVKQRRWLSILLTAWGLAWALRAFGLIVGNSAPMYGEVLPPVLIMVGIITAVTFLLWPVSIVNPKGIRLRSLLIFGSPFTICIALYWGIIWIFGLQCFSLTSLGEFREHISYFSVWYRLVMCACLLGYFGFTMRLINRCVRQYNRYVEENYAEYEKYTIHWIPRYLIGLVAILVFYFINLCFASYKTFLCHNIVSCLFIAWLSAKIMVYKSPFVSDRTEPDATEPTVIKGEDFNSRFEQYKMQIELWMKTERPYLSSDFSLHDIMTRFGLNRTYASKIFNEGFGKSFILVVRDYRIEYAREIIRNNPAIAMSEVAHLCGYSTAQAFHKAFVYCNDGLTPGKFAKLYARKG